MRHGGCGQCGVAVLVHAVSVHGGVAGIGSAQRTRQALHLSAVRHGISEKSAGVV